MSHISKSIFGVIATVSLITGCKTSHFNWVDNPTNVIDTKKTDIIVPNPKLVTPMPAEPTEIVSSPGETPANLVSSLPSNTVTPIEEKFIQNGKKGDADILIVIDDSDTMKEEQANLSSKLSDLLVELKDSNWQIGVITTTVRVENNLDKCVMTLIKSTDVGFEDKFKAAVTPGITGSLNEEGIRQAANGLRCPQRPWIRPNASVAVLIVSDEDNCSDGRGCLKQPQRDIQYLINYVENDMQRVLGVNAGFYGIFSPPSSPCASAFNVANQYQKLVDYSSNGNLNYGNICDTSYRETLQRISKNIAQLLDNQFTLKSVPDAGTLKLVGKKANGAALTTADYSVKGSALIFVKGHEPALNSEVVVTYTATTP